jgi:desulfoferrodoxin (superoxide reductase-like protein)
MFNDSFATMIHSTIPSIENKNIKSIEVSHLYSNDQHIQCDLSLTLHDTRTQHIIAWKQLFLQDKKNTPKVHENQSLCFGLQEWNKK